MASILNPLKCLWARLSGRLAREAIARHDESTAQAMRANLIHIGATHAIMFPEDVAPWIAQQRREAAHWQEEEAWQNQAAQVEAGWRERYGRGK